MALDNYSFLSDGGEMGALIRAYDWENSDLGPPGVWSQSLKRALRLLLSSGHPMFIWWGQGLVQFYNDAYKRSLGAERHPSALGQKGRECWEEIWHIIGAQIEQVMTGDGHTWHENQLVPMTRDGRLEDVYWTYSYNPIDDPGMPNGVGGVLVVCTETTAQVLAEQRRAAAEARWRELFMQAPSFMCILTGPQHIFEFANPRYFELVNNRELIGKTLREALPEVQDQGFLELLDEVYRTGVPYNASALPVSLAREGDGFQKKVYLDFVYQPIVNSKGQVTGIFVDGYDVTERVLAGESLRVEGRRKDEFLAMLAHELRNPLAPIRNASELLTQIFPAASSERALGDIIKRQTTQLTRLVDDLLDISRITRGRIKLQFEPLELTHIIRLALESLQPVIEEKHHEVIYAKNDRLFFVSGDAARLIQCVTNVLANATKYTGPQGYIHVSVNEVDAMAVIAITDNGIGIAPEMLDEIFELFVQADHTLDRSQGGLGIGLSIVHKLLQMHGGWIKAASEGLGKGSTFLLALPLMASPGKSAAKPWRGVVTPMRILIVDDNIDAADTLAQLLQLKGHETLAVYSASEAITLAQTFDADIILLDIGLPDIDGYDVARRIRNHGSDSVLIALTGYGQAEDIQRAYDAGFNAHVTKPVAFDDLEEVLERYRQ